MDDSVLEATREQTWLNNEDFDKAIAVARKRYPEPAASYEKIVTLPAASDPDLKETAPMAPALKESRLKDGPGAPNPPTQTFDMRVESWPARFAPPWRVRIKR